MVLMCRKPDGDIIVVNLDVFENSIACRHRNGLLTKADGSEWCSDHDGQWCFSTLVRCSCITFARAEGEEGSQTETLRLPAESNFGPFTQQAWEWQMLCLLRTKQRKCMLLRHTLSNIFDKQQADYGVALHKQLSISSTACKVKVARWTLHGLSQLRHFTLVKVSISF